MGSATVLPPPPLPGLRIVSICHDAGWAVACPLSGRTVALAVGHHRGGLDAPTDELAATEVRTAADHQVRAAIEDSWLLVGCDAGALYSTAATTLGPVAPMAGLTLLSQDELLAGAGGGGEPWISAGGSARPRLRRHRHRPGGGAGGGGAGGQAGWTMTLTGPLAELVVTS